MKRLSYVNAIKLLAVAIVLLGLIVATLSSCGTRNGYGCKGNQSWDRMVRRINSP
jgi:hypothetical protein